MRAQQQPSEGLEMGRDRETKIQTELEAGWYKQRVFVAVKASREISEETARHPIHSEDPSGTGTHGLSGKLCTYIWKGVRARRSQKQGRLRYIGWG
jgi:hypothetical protein